MKNKYLLVFLLPVLVLMSYSGGAPSGYTGSPGDNNQTCAACHSPGNSLYPNIVISGIPTSGYVLGHTYNVRLQVSNTSNPKTGFQITIENSSNQKLGGFSPLNANTQSSQGGNYITHTLQGSDLKDWIFYWTAPSTSQGDVKLYYAINFANGNGNSTGDYIFHDNITIHEDTSASISESNDGNIEIYPNPTQNYINIKSDIKIDNIYIYNVSGQKINTEIKNNKIDISKLTKGNYVLKLVSNGKILSKQFIKK